MYGCQLTFGSVFDQNFTPAAVWQFANHAGALPYLDINGQVANPNQPAANFHNPSTTWETPGQALNGAAVQASNQPGAQWWDKYHAAFWWP